MRWVPDVGDKAAIAKVAAELVPGVDEDEWRDWLAAEEAQPVRDVVAFADCVREIMAGAARRTGGGDDA